MAQARAAMARLRTLASEGALEDWAPRHGVRAVVAFGSAVADTGPARDLDVAVLLSTGASLLSVVNGLIALVGFDGIDVLDLGRGGPVVREQALVGGEALYEDERGLVAELQIAATSQRMDTEWLHRLRLEALAR